MKGVAGAVLPLVLLALLVIAAASFAMSFKVTLDAMAARSALTAVASRSRSPSTPLPWKEASNHRLFMGRGQRSASARPSMSRPRDPWRLPNQRRPTRRGPVQMHPNPRSPGQRCPPDPCQSSP
jgi:hypothetical protein